MIQEIAAESEQTRGDRRNLTDKLERLEKAMRICAPYRGRTPIGKSLAPLGYEKVMLTRQSEQPPLDQNRLVQATGYGIHDDGNESEGTL